MQLISNLLILCGVFATPFLHAQKPVKKQNIHVRYSAPIDIQMLLSGNYGEIRTAGFHTGIDIKTDQAEGKNILAANDGYVFRIVVSSGGYGKALYLKHPEGQVTVYAHLKQFTPVIEDFVMSKQYLQNSFEVDLYPEAEQFVFNRGEFLGFSGNTGNSEGPHLHFEIRDETSSVPLNALEYSLNISDETRPRINTLAVYPLDQQSTVNNLNEKLLVEVTGQNGSYYPETGNIKVKGKIGLGIETYDYLDNSSNKCSPSTISLLKDERQVFFCHIDSIPFSMGPCVNSHIDYEEKVKTGKKIQKLFVDPNNRLKIYKVAVNRGILTVNDTLEHVIKILVRDTYGNESGLLFKLKGTGPVSKPVRRVVDPSVVGRFRYDTLNVFENRDIRVVIPRNALFDHIDFRYMQTQHDSCPWSMIHQVHHEYTALSGSYILSIRSPNLPLELQSKAVIAGPGKNGSWASQGGTYNNGFVTNRVRTFGTFFIAVDTIKPLISPLSFITDGRYASEQVLSFTISDTGSGIRKYNGYIDNKWALFEYDAKSDLLTYTIDESRLDKNRTHGIMILVTDNKDNVSTYKSEFFY